MKTYPRQRQQYVFAGVLGVLGVINLLFFFISFVSFVSLRESSLKRIRRSRKQENRRALRPAALFEKRKKRTCYYSGLRVRIRGVLGSFI